MKRYAVFVMANFYPNGGWNDFQADFETLEEAKTFLANHPKLRPRPYKSMRQQTWDVYDAEGHVVDIEEGKIFYFYPEAQVTING